MKKYTPKELSNMIESKLSHNFGTLPENASDEVFYKACVLVVLDIMRPERAAFKEKAAQAQAKNVYYLSMEFLMGRSLKNTLYNLGLTDKMSKALKNFDVKLENLYEQEPDAGLGNGGLGRLAACFLDGLSSGAYPAMGYCIKYDYGIFRQKFVDGYQTEMPDFWLPGGSVWLEMRPSHVYDVLFDGYVKENWHGIHHDVSIENATVVKAVAYDLMVAGKDGKGINVLRLWSATAPDKFDMQSFNQGNYIKALEQNAMAEVISKVLYPEDNHMEGKSLRLRQQYFLVSASIQDILQRHLKQYGTLDNLAEKAAIHINDTHPALVIPELMRYFLDECGYEWDKAWEIVCKTAAYTNHTVMSEALECWQEDLFRQRLPRIYQIITEIDHRYRRQVWEQTGESDYVERTAIISAGVVRMANLCVAACHSVNGVSELHSNILKESVFKDYYNLTPTKFTNVTNGIAHRRWLCQSNPGLSKLITELIGDGFVNNAAELEKLKAFGDDASVLKKLEKIKLDNKKRLATRIKADYGIEVDPNSIFDMQVKRLHEYKRQQLNALHIISEYLYLKNNPEADFVPKTYIFGAKAAPGYMVAKNIIRMIWQLSQIVNNDPDIGGKLKIVFMEDYRVTLAELMMPAAEISEQISLAGTEASGTGNMKLMLNGAITLGTEDGANVEIHRAVGDENIFIFGLLTEEVNKLRALGYDPMGYYCNNPKIKEAIDFINSGIGGQDFSSIGYSLMHSDYYMALADFADYCKIHEKASAMYKDREAWNRMSLMNIAGAGKFASDRSIEDYANNIWQVKPVL